MNFHAISSEIGAAARRRAARPMATAKQLKAAVHARRLVKGLDTFGLADAATTVLGITAQNVPLKLVAVYNQTGTMGLIYHPGSD